MNFRPIVFACGTHLELAVYYRDAAELAAAVSYNSGIDRSVLVAGPFEAAARCDGSRWLPASSECNNRSARG